MTPWLTRITLSLLLAALAGGLAYVIARGASGAYLLLQQRQFVEQTSDVIRSGDLLALGASDLRAQRRVVRALEAEYALLSVRTGFAVAAVTAVAAYLRLETQNVHARRRAA